MTMQDKSAKTCVLYCRVSSYDQVEGTSLESQERACREYAARQGWEVYETFIERGESAKTANRTELNKAIFVCKREKVGFFVVYKLDRFARNQDDHVTVRALLRRQGTELRSVTEPIDSSPIGRAMEGILSVFAELDNNIRAERSRQGMLERVKQGVWVWPEPLGYLRRSRGRGSNIEPDPATAPLVRMIFEEYAKGTYTYEALAELMAARGLTTTTGRKPRKQLILRILQSPVYCGVIEVWGERHKGSFEPIVAQELFEICQRLRLHSSTGQPAGHATDNPLFPLRRLVVCARCRLPFTGGRSTGRSRRYPYYHHYHKQNCPTARCIPKDDFEGQFACYLKQISPNPRFEKIFRQVVRDRWSERFERSRTEQARLQKEVAELEQERQQIFDLHRQGVYTTEDFRAQLARNGERTKQKHALMNQNVPEFVDIDAVLDCCFGIIRHTGDVWQSLEKNHEARMRFQNQVFDGTVEFDGSTFGTADLSLIYKLCEESENKKSRLVALVERNWKQVLEELETWVGLSLFCPTCD